MVWIYRRTNTIMFILHCSRYSAWFKRHKSSVPPPELRQKLSPFCVLVLWLKPTFKQCRNTVEMKVWFNHLACHWKLMLARRGFTPSAFPWFQHLYIQLGSVCKDAGWVVCGAPGHTQPVQSMNPVPGSLVPPSRLADWHRQSMRRAWRPQKPAPVPEGKGEPLKMGKQRASLEHRTPEETCVTKTTSRFI